MKTNSINAMKNLFKTFLLGLTLMVSVNANAGWGDNIGDLLWRSDAAEGQGIAWEFLNDKIIYAKTTKTYSLDNADKESICSGSRRGQILFDVPAEFCNNRNSIDNYYMQGFTFDSDGLTWNYYHLLLPLNLKDKLSGQIIEVQMGSTITKIPPKFLRVMEKSDACKDDGPIIPRSNHKIICNGWSWESLRQYWGKDVPPELKALNGTGVIKSVEDVSTTHATGVISAEPSSPVVITNPQ